MSSLISDLLKTTITKTDKRFMAISLTDNFAVNLADFNNDGFSEVYVGNEIFDAITGTRLAVGGPNNIGNNIYNFYSHEQKAN